MKKTKGLSVIFRERISPPLFELGEEICWKAKLESGLTGTIVGYWRKASGIDPSDDGFGENWHTEGWIYVIVWHHKPKRLLPGGGYYGLAPEKDIFCPKDFK